MAKQTTKAAAEKALDSKAMKANPKGFKAHEKQEGRKVETKEKRTGKEY